MRVWHTYGAFGDRVVELTWREILKFVWTGELDLGCSTVLSIGKSNMKALGCAESREDQLARQDMGL